MKKLAILLLLSAALSLNASDQKTESEKKKQQAVQAVYAQFVVPITPPESRRALMSRRFVLPAMYYDTEVLDENSEVPGEFTFRVRERHRVAGKKPHPRDGLIVHTGYYEAHTGKVYALDRKSNRYVPAEKHPKVIAGKKIQKQQAQNSLIGLKNLRLKPAQK